jgi:hypothetical protein
LAWIVGSALAYTEMRFAHRIPAANNDSNSGT